MLCFLYLLVPDDNSILANSILNNLEGSDFFSIPFSDLKFQPTCLQKNSSTLDAALYVKNTNQVKKITEKEIGSFQTLTFKVISQKKIKRPGPGTYDHELKVEPFSLGIEGLPAISRIVFEFGYGQSLEGTPGSLMKTKLYNSKLLTESVGKTFTMKINFWNISEIDNDNGGVLNFSSSENFEVDSFQETTNGQSNNSPPPTQSENNDNSSTPERNKELIISLGIILTILGLIIVFLVMRNKRG